MSNKVKVIFVAIGFISFAIVGYILSGRTPTNIVGTSTGSTSISTKVFEKGGSVTFTYTGAIKGGDVFEVSEKPVTISFGNENVPVKMREALLGMKAGDKKTIELAPDDAFGGKTLENTLPKEAFADKIEQTLPMDFFQSEVVRTVPLETVPGATIGKQVDLGNGIVGEVTYLSGGVVSVKIPNPVHPFKDKKLSVGAEDVYGSGSITVLAIDGNNVKVEMDNVMNPFWKKKLEIGLSAPMLNGSGSVEVTKITDTDVTVRYDNLHPLAGKTVLFDINVIEVK